MRATAKASTFSVAAPSVKASRRPRRRPGASRRCRRRIGWHQPTRIADPAASSFWAGDGYDLAKSGERRNTSDELIAFYQKWLEAFPIVLIEGGIDENDW